MTYETPTFARLAGALSLLVALSTWGLLSLLVVGETTVTTWALGLAALFPASAVVLGVVAPRFPQAGKQYAVGVVVGVVTLSLTYIGVAAADQSLLGAVAALDSLELLAGALAAGVVVGTLAVVDRRYVEHPPSAALLEARHLDEPIGDD